MKNDSLALISNFDHCAEMHLNWRGLPWFSPKKKFLNVITQSKTKGSVSVFYLDDCRLVDHNKTISDA